MPGERTERVMCRMRSLGMLARAPARSARSADTVPKIIEELISVRRSERELASSITIKKARWR